LSDQSKTPIPRIGKLKTTGQVLTEMGRLYREWKRGERHDASAKTGMYLLTSIRQTIEAGDLERRVEELEVANAAKTSD
jgi:hypothetical protein